VVWPALNFKITHLALTLFDFETPGLYLQTMCSGMCEPEAHIPSRAILALFELTLYVRLW
jgi:hypothetical protein